METCKSFGHFGLNKKRWGFGGLIDRVSRETGIAPRKKDTRDRHRKMTFFSGGRNRKCNCKLARPPEPSALSAMQNVRKRMNKVCQSDRFTC